MLAASSPGVAFAMFLALADAVFSFPTARNVVAHEVPVAAIVQLAVTAFGNAQGQSENIVPTLLGP